VLGIVPDRVDFKVLAVFDVASKLIPGEGFEFGLIDLLVQVGRVALVESSGEGDVVLLEHIVASLDGDPGASTPTTFWLPVDVFEVGVLQEIPLVAETLGVFNFLGEFTLLVEAELIAKVGDQVGHLVNVIVSNVSFQAKLIGGGKEGVHSLLGSLKVVLSLEGCSNWNQFKPVDVNFIP